MAKWWELLKALLAAWLGFERAKKAEQVAATAEAQLELQDWGGKIEQEVKDNEARAHQEIVASMPIDGGRRAALARLERLRRSTGGGD